MRVMAFDQSITSSALVVLDENDSGKWLRLSSKEVLKPKSTDIYRLVSIDDWINSKFLEHSPDFVVRELHNQRQWGAAGALPVIGSFIDAVAYRKCYLDDFRYARISAGTWKKFCLGKGNLKKDTAYLIHLNRFFQTSPHLSVPSDFEIVDDNIADAICLAITGYVARKIKMDQPAGVTDSAKFTALKGVLDKIFSYGSV